MPPANIVFTDMVTSSIGVQTSCPNSPTYTHLYGDNTEDICPSHFTDIHRTKLEDTFSRKQKPDDIQLQIIAMECNLLYKDVRDWFKARRIKWIEDLVRNESTVYNTKHDTNNNNTSSSTILSKNKHNNNNNNNNTTYKHNNTIDLKNNKKAITAAVRTANDTTT